MQHGGHRLKLLASDDNEIDSMFVDKRGKTDKGDKLVKTGMVVIADDSITFLSRARSRLSVLKETQRSTKLAV